MLSCLRRPAVGVCLILLRVVTICKQPRSFIIATKNS